jgi:hypothetical protein
VAIRTQGIYAAAVREVERYHCELVARLVALLGDELLGIYAGGSLALGAYEHGRSDLDVAAVSAGALPVERKRELVAELRHEALPCPARGLELVVYPAATTLGGGTEPGYELDLNTGAAMDFRAAFAPDDAASHWYAIDRAILREHGVPLRGPAPAELFAPIPRAALLPLLAAGVRLYAGGEGPLDAAVSKICRALRFAREGVWTSKPAATAWALQREEPELVRAVVAARRGERGLQALARLVEAELAAG